MIANYSYSYEKLSRNERQYDDINLSTEKIVRAKYVDTCVYNGNPYIEALPLARTAEEVKTTFNTIPSLPDRKKFYDLPEQIQEMAISKIRDYRIALPFHVDIEKEFSRTLVESYSSRMQKKNKESLMVDGISYPVTHRLTAFHAGEATNGFAMLGVAGSGKSTAMNMVLDHYPQVIIHDFGDETIIQIVYLYVTCEPNSNFNALYGNIGKAIDAALGNDTHVFEKEINSTKYGGLSAKSLKIKDLIEKFSIGTIILDEIQNIDLKSTKENSLEALLTINNSTHVGLGVLGTEEAFHDLFSKERTARRLSAYIAAGRYCNNEVTFTNIIHGLFLAQVFEKNVTVSAEIVNAFYKETDGIIAHVVLLYYYMTKDYISRKKKPEITPEYICRISSTNRKIIHDTVNRNHRSTHVSNISRKKLISEINNYGISEAQEKNDSEFSKAVDNSPVFMKASVSLKLSKKYKEYNASEVERAVEKAVLNGAQTESETAKQALSILKNRKADSEQKEQHVPDLPVIDKEKIIQDLLGCREALDNA